MSSSSSGCSISSRPNGSRPARCRASPTRVRGVGVDLQQDVVAESLAHRRDRLEVPARLDLQLDPHVARVEIALDRVEQFADRVHDADRDATRHAVAHGAEFARQRSAGRTQFGVEHAHLERRLGHPMAAELRQRRRDGVRVEVVDRGERRDEETAQHIGRGVDVLRRVQRVGHRDALAPALGVAGDDPQQQGIAARLGAEGRAERRDERHRDASQFNAGQLHRSSPLAASGRASTYHPARSNPVTARPVGHQPVEHFAHRDAPVLRAARIAHPQRFDVRRDGHEHGVAVERSEHRVHRAARRSARSPHRPLRSASASATVVEPTHAATTDGSSSDQCTSSRSLSSPALIVSCMPP